MGKSVHAAIMRAVPWVAVGVLGIFSISQLASRGTPAGEPAPTHSQVPVDRAPADESPAAVTATAAHDDSQLQAELLSLRNERADLRDRILALERELARERLRGERHAAVAAARGAREAARTETVEELTQELAAARDRISELTEPTNDTPAADGSAPFEQRVVAFRQAQGKDRVAAAASVLTDPHFLDQIVKHEALLGELCEVVRGLPAGGQRDALAHPLLHADFDAASAALGPDVTIGAVAVLGLLRRDDRREELLRYLATNAPKLSDPRRTEAAVASERIIEAPGDFEPSVLAAGVRALALLRPPRMPIEALARLLGHADASTRAAAAHALSRARDALAAKDLRAPCLAMLGSSHVEERVAGALLGERVFDDFAFDPHAPADERAQALEKLAQQAGS